MVRTLNVLAESKGVREEASATSRRVAERVLKCASELARSRNGMRVAEKIEVTDFVDSKKLPVALRADMVSLAQEDIAGSVDLLKSLSPSVRKLEANPDGGMMMDNEAMNSLYSLRGNRARKMGITKEYLQHIRRQEELLMGVLMEYLRYQRGQRCNGLITDARPFNLLL
ncbi:hypothetical protein SARC_08052 [Sphaeroforma arctica JP610]|uniref:Uncharacterized protein n=1 Tax=Sphaeroforma arctica JP610 TaxID=667725 RepID=A0A0L0FUE5_9EUKA|nr:hypothetical protein SARC_08052 [Sphaeroforma arctica JP610]KNC79553.1 hypothetical protein SARC_08052 [Sphaeroforma arctica JP610]|eukprot:XP_014153455.1 hypothetical protein SARC_08052 [Sphaeroforma arctica JP610]